jgi:hypothetical protein
MAHTLGKIRPYLAAVTGLVDVVVRRHVDDIGIPGMELDDDDRIAAIAPEKRKPKQQKQKAN